MSTNELSSKIEALREWETVIAETVPPKFRELNLKAYRAGYEAVSA